MSTKQKPVAKKPTKKPTAAPKKSLKAAPAKTTPKPAKKKVKGIRYTASQKAAIVKFVIDNNSSTGRGGVAAATRKFNVSPITINNWLKKAGAPATPKKGKASKASKATKKPTKVGLPSVTATLNKMAKISAKIEKLETEFNKLKSSL